MSRYFTEDYAHWMQEFERGEWVKPDPFSESNTRYFHKHLDDKREKYMKARRRELWATADNDWLEVHRGRRAVITAMNGILTSETRAQEMLTIWDLEVREEVAALVERRDWLRRIGAPS